MKKHKYNPGLNTTATLALCYNLRLCNWGVIAALPNLLLTRVGDGISETWSKDADTGAKTLDTMLTEGGRKRRRE